MQQSNVGYKRRIQWRRLQASCWTMSDYSEQKATPHMLTT